MTQLVNFSSQQDFPSNTGNTLFIIHWISLWQQKCCSYCWRICFSVGELIMEVCVMQISVLDIPFWQFFNILWLTNISETRKSFNSKSWIQILNGKIRLKRKEISSLPKAEITTNTCKNLKKLVEMYCKFYIKNATESFQATTLMSVLQLSMNLFIVPEVLVFSY